MDKSILVLIIGVVWVMLGILILIVDARINAKVHSNWEAWAIVILYPFILIGVLLGKIFRLGDAIADLAGLKRHGDK
jgi:hypothetical protein